MSGVALVTAESVMGYFTSRWNRAQLTAFGAPVPPDLGQGRDEICPVIYFSQPFDPGNDDSLSNLSEYTAAELRTREVSSSLVHGVGYITVNLAEIDSKQLDRGSRGSFIGRDRVLFIIAAPESNGAQLADQYAAALTALFNGVDLRPASGGVQRIWNDPESESITQRPNNVGRLDGWLWFTVQVVLRRLFRQSRAGVQPITPP